MAAKLQIQDIILGSAELDVTVSSNKAVELKRADRDRTHRDRR